jgi:hypothetical protein
LSSARTSSTPATSFHVVVDDPFVAMFCGFVRGIDPSSLQSRNAVKPRTRMKKTGSHAVAKSRKSVSHWEMSEVCGGTYVAGGGVVVVAVVAVVVGVVAASTDVNALASRIRPHRHPKVHL